MSVYILDAFVGKESLNRAKSSDVSASIVVEEPSPSSLHNPPTNLAATKASTMFTSLIGFSDEATVSDSTRAAVRRYSVNPSSQPTTPRDNMPGIAETSSSAPQKNTDQQNRQDKTKEALDRINTQMTVQSTLMIQRKPQPKHSPTLASNWARRSSSMGSKTSTPREFSIEKEKEKFASGENLLSIPERIAESPSSSRQGSVPVSARSSVSSNGNGIQESDYIPAVPLASIVENQSHDSPPATARRATVQEESVRFTLNEANANSGAIDSEVTPVHAIGRSAVETINSVPESIDPSESASLETKNFDRAASMIALKKEPSTRRDSVSRYVASVVFTVTQSPNADSSSAVTVSRNTVQSSDPAASSASAAISEENVSIFRTPPRASKPPDQSATHSPSPKQVAIPVLTPAGSLKLKRNSPSTRYLSILMY